MLPTKIEEIEKLLDELHIIEGDLVHLKAEEAAFNERRIKILERIKEIQDASCSS